MTDYEIEGNDTKFRYLMYFFLGFAQTEKKWDTSVEGYMSVLKEMKRTGLFDEDFVGFDEFLLED